MKKIINTLFVLIIIIVIISLYVNIYVFLKTKNNIKHINDIQDKDIDCIIILGAGISGEEPSPMLEDRLLTGRDFYNNGLTNKIIVSGDHGQEEYDEVNVMKTYLIDQDIPDENIFMDHAGFSTYDSIYRAKEIFKTKKVIIISQKYHLYRALYIADSLELKAYGISANRRDYPFQFKRDIREFFARIKDFIKCIFKPKSKYLGEIIPVTGNGKVTNDK